MPAGNYADVLYGRKVLHSASKVIEGCVGNIGWQASLEVAKYLGKDALYTMVDVDAHDLSVHKRMFLQNYRANLVLGTPRFEWIEGRIENQQKIISQRDILLFHNYMPVDAETFEGRQDGSLERMADLFAKLIYARPEYIVFFLPYRKNSDFVSQMLSDPQWIQCENVDNVHFAGDLGDAKPEEWMGRVIIAHDKHHKPQN